MLRGAAYRLGVALLFLLAAILIRVGFDQLGAKVPFVTFFPAVLGAAVLGGMTAGLLVAVGGALYGYWVFMGTPFQFHVPNLGYSADLVLYTLSALAVAWVGSSWAKKKASLETATRRHMLLLDEFSHRVKNHLAMIIGVLRLKGARQTDPQAKEDFARAIDRISTISHLHQQLYQAEDIASVEVEKYVGEICKNVQQSMLLETKVVLERQLEPTVLHVDQAVPVGLIVNELITNAIKYAFEPNKGGKIIVSWSTSGSTATLTVCDTGRGLDTSASRQGVGTRLVRDLARQIGATSEVASQPNEGTTYSFTFALKPTVSRRN